MLQHMCVCVWSSHYVCQLPNLISIEEKVVYTHTCRISNMIYSRLGRLSSGNVAGMINGCYRAFPPQT